MSETTQVIIAVLIAGVAFLYGSVGHGGASGYLALMALFSVAPAEMKPMALCMNLAVSAMAFYQYWKAGQFRMRLFLPFALTSVPMSYLGSAVTPGGDWYARILGIILLVPAFRLFGLFGKSERPLHDPPVPIALAVGAAIGFVAGLIGVGGGILLSPLMIWMSWSDMKQTAAVSALFIFVNSSAALAAILPSGFHMENYSWVWIASAFTGGTLGAHLGSHKLNQVALKRILGTVLLVASAKLLGL